VVLVPYLRCNSRTVFYSAVVNHTVVAGLVGVVDSLPCTILGSATKRLKESDLVVTQPSNNFGKYSLSK